MRRWLRSQPGHHTEEAPKQTAFQRPAQTEQQTLDVGPLIQAFPADSDAWV